MKRETPHCDAGGKNQSNREPLFSLGRERKRVTHSWSRAETNPFNVQEGWEGKKRGNVDELPCFPPREGGKEEIKNCPGRSRTRERRETTSRRSSMA